MVNPSNWRLGGSSFSFSTEMAGAVVTYLLLEIVLGTRQKKETLIANIGSQIKDVAVSAAEELGRNGWLHNGSLEGAILNRATLANADLRGATLQCAELFHANIGA